MTETEVEKVLEAGAETEEEEEDYLSVLCVTPTPGEETFVHLALILLDTTTDLHTVTHPPEILFNLSSSHSSATQSTHF